MIGPKAFTELNKQDVEPAMQYIHRYWHTLKRKTTPTNSTLIGLPHAFVVPSVGDDSFVFEEQYYWDSYFIALGLNDEKLVTGMLDNLIFMFEEFGLIPNANRYYFMSRSQPPILTTFIFHVYEKYNKSEKWLRKYIEVAKQEYHHVWMSKKHPYDHLVRDGLSRYYDINYLHDLAEAESGWDMTPRFKRQCLDYLPIDLNCLLYKYEKDFERAARIIGTPSEADVWQFAAEERRKAVNNLMWHKRKAFYFDYNFQDKTQGSVWSLAGYYALWSGLATEHEAKKLVKNLWRFERKGGLTTTAGTFMYTDLFGSRRTQWAYPNGWAPLHFIAIEGLEKYGYTEEAHRLTHKWLKTCNDWFINKGEFLEKYNVVNPKDEPARGLYPSQTGFAWTNAVFVYLVEKYITNEIEQ